MSTTEQVMELKRKMEESDKTRELHCLQVRYYELERQLVQLEIDRINVSGELEVMAAKIKRRGEA